MHSHDINQVLSRFPLLNAHGMTIFSLTPKKERAARFQEDREELLNDIEGCTMAETWLTKQERQSRVNSEYSSYGFKHLFEDEIGYVTNGAFIVAAIHLRFTYNIDKDSPNVGFGIRYPPRSLRRIIQSRRNPCYNEIPLAPKERFNILKRDGCRCCICGRSAADGITLHVDHRVSRADGGSNDPDNLWTLCEPCNLGKGSYSMKRPAIHPLG